MNSFIRDLQDLDYTNFLKKLAKP